MTEFLQVSTATDTRESAQNMARSVVEARLAAGAQIVGPVATVVLQEGEPVAGEEWRLLLDTQTDRYKDLEAHLLRLHTWHTPQIVAVPIAAGSDGYLHWVRSSTMAVSPARP
jgi:periplasmic divalent cation tolerance protein